MTQIKLPKKKLSTLFNDGKMSAEAINLVYVSDNDEGISRVRKEQDFIYLLRGKPVKDNNTLLRIKKLVLPPAWERVWICKDPNGHLQATGYDTLNRKQYRYHPLWNEVRHHTKFSHLYDFGKVLPAIRQQLDRDLRRPGLPLEKVLATIVALMQKTCIRVGSSQYEKLYGSFGLTTLKDRHVTFKGSSMQFTFIGKKSVHQNIGIESKRLAKIVKQCRDIPGKELFQYYDENGQRHPVDSGMVNNYIKEISGGVFTAKDFRTWAGTLHAIEAFKEIGCCDTETGIKKNIVAALDMVARQLGNTRTVCKKYYVHPAVIDLYSTGSLTRYLDKLDSMKCENEELLTASEHILMSIMQDCSAPVIAA